MDTHSETQCLSQLLRERRSVRDFRPDPIPPEVLEAVLADANAAPSWSNTQPYRIAVATGPVRDSLAAALGDRYDMATRALAGGLAGKFRLLLSRKGLPDGDFKTDLAYPDALQPARRATGQGLYRVLGIDRQDTAARARQMRRNFEFFGAPAALFVFVHGGLREFAVLDAGIYLQSLMLSAHAHGLATCAQGALATWGGPVRAAFDVPPAYGLICGVSLGYASDHPVNAYNPGRRPPEAQRLPLKDPSNQGTA
jgi:nitroreductase